MHTLVTGIVKDGIKTHLQNGNAGSAFVLLLLYCGLSLD